LKRTNIVVVVAVISACLTTVALTGAGCGGGGTGATSGTSGTSGGTAGSSGGDAAGGRGGSTGAGGSAGTGGIAGAGSGGRGGTTLPGDAGTIGSSGRGGAAGSAGGTAGGAGSAGRGGAGGMAGAVGSAGRGGGAGGFGGANVPGDAGAFGLGGRGGAAGSAGSAGRGGASGATGGGGGMLANPRIMPLGDSTTAAICYRSHLAQMLNSAGKTYNFIGSRKGDPGCSFTNYDQDNEGHGGYIVTDILKTAGTGVRPGGADANDPYVSDSRDLATWFDNRPADIVLMHFGTNDVWNNKTPASILNAYTAILNKLRMVNPNVRVLVAQITSLQPSGCSDCPTRVQTLNGMIPGWATANSMTTSPITVVDQNTGFNAAMGMDTVDGVHANDAGSIKIATQWFNALAPLF
jgi:hypothetical protein